MTDEAPADGAPTEGAEEAPADATPAEGEEAKPEGEGGADNDGIAGGGTAPKKIPEMKPPPDTGVKDRIRKDPHDLNGLNFVCQFPEKLDITLIPKMSEARMVWSQGLRKVEQAFQEAISNMHMEFE